MSIDSQSVQQWLDAYSHAWLTYDPAEIGALFSEDAEYLYHPWDTGDDVVHGREAIIANWLENRDKPGVYRGEYQPLLVAGDQAVTTGMSWYYSDETQTTLERAFHNLWTLRFDDAGKCRSFTEWYMEAPKPKAK